MSKGHEVTKPKVRLLNLVLGMLDCVWLLNKICTLETNKDQDNCDDV